MHVTISPEALLAALSGIATFMLFHLGGAIWFASRLNAQMKVFSQDLHDAVAEIKTLAQGNTRIAVLEVRVMTLENRLQSVVKVKGD